MVERISDIERLRAFLIPGVVSGTIEQETSAGRYVMDFDNRDDFGNPTLHFYPAEPK